MFGGTSTGTSSVSSPYATPLGNMGKSLWATAQPLIKTIGADFLEALRTGGVNSFLPWITRALDASRRSSSMGIQDMRQNLARTGLGGSSFGEQELDTAQTAAGDEANQIPANMIMQMIQGAPGFATNLSRGATANYEAAGGLDQTRQTTYTPSFWEQFMQGFGGGGFGAGAFAGGVP